MTRRCFQISTLALLLASGCIADPELKLADEHVPVTRNDGWVVATPQAEGIDPGKLDEAYRLFFSEDRFRTAYSLLVVRNGKLVGEGYCRDRRDIDVKRNIKSCTKTFTSLLTGIALQQGLIDSLDDKLFDYLPEYFDDDPQKRRITIRQALTMQTGLAYNNDHDNEGLLVDRPESSLRYVLKDPLDFAPGTRFHYSDSPPHLVGGVIQKTSGHTLLEFAHKRLFAPLGITDVLWEQHRDGLSYGAFGLYMTPRDLAKVGQLCLQQGRWNGEQIVPSEWLAEATSIHANRNSGPYGYYWWVRPDFNAYTMAGHGGNFVYVIPDKQMVLVFTAMPFVDGGIQIPLADFEDIVRILVDAAA